MISFIQSGFSTTNNEMISSYRYSSSSLDSAQQELQACEAYVSPALTNISERISNARDQLQIIMDRQMPNGLGSSTNSGIIVTVMRALSLDQQSIDSRNMSFLEDSSSTIVKEATRTSTRRQGYVALFNIVGSHLLPDIKCLLPAKNDPGTLSLADRVETSTHVKIKEGSYLDSPKYRASGPALVMLTQKTINCIIDAQNPGEELEIFHEQLNDVAKDLFRLNLQIACDMRYSPDELSLHIEYIGEVRRIIEDFQALIHNPPKQFHPYALGFHTKLRTTETSLGTWQDSRTAEQPIEGISESKDIISLIINGKKYIHENVHLNWNYVLEKVLPPMGISTMEVANFQEYHRHRGSFAIIYEATLSNGIKVALKRPFGDSEDALCLRFIRELYIWWKAGNHPNIHRLLGIYFMKKEKVPVMVSSWCDNGSLASTLQSPVTNWSRREQLRLALQVARGLQHLHSRNIVHGDLKPDNILMEDGNAKLHDFGISRIQDDAQGLSTKTHGNYAYQAPEIIQALERETRPHACATAESDIYSFANVLFKCLTLQAPFSQLSSISKIPGAVLDEFKRPLDPDYGVVIRGEGKEELVRLMTYCWHRDPGPRPSADYVVRKLEEIEMKILVKEAKLAYDTID